MVPSLLVALSLAVSAPPTGKLTVHFFDVGQGDSALVTTPSGKNVLIDGGPPEAGSHLALRLKALVHGPLDLVVLSHPHLDHLGGMERAVRAVGAKAYLESGFDHPLPQYRELLEYMGSIVERNIPTADPEHPEKLSSLDLGEGATMWILWPRIGPQGKAVDEFLTGTRSDPNSNSVVLKIVYGKTAFLMVGDAEPDTEAYLLDKPIDLTSTVLKVGHHGGRHSSTAPFLAKVKPKIAVISCAAVNDYGHPGRETLARLGDAGARVFRTDQDGEVTVVSDGHQVQVTSARGGRHAEEDGETSEVVALGPIVPGRRSLSEASVEDKKRFRKGGLIGAPPRLPPEDVRTAHHVVPILTPAPAPAADVQYIASKRSHVFHTVGCKGGAVIREENRLTFKTREEASVERTPAGDCKP